MQPHEIDKAVVLELRRWWSHQEPWVMVNVITGILDIRESAIRRSLQRLKAQGLAKHECRAGYRYGFWCYVPPVQSGIRSRR